MHVQFADPLVRTTLAAQAELATALRNTGRHWMVGYQAACLAFLDGRLDESLEMAAGNYATAPVSRSRAAGTYWMHQLVVRLAQGRDAGLEGEVDAIMADQPGLPGWHAVAAWLAARRGDHARALAECDLVDGGRALPRDMAWSGAAVYLARAVAAAGDPVRAAALTELLEPYGGLMTWYGSGTVGPFDLALAELAEVQGDIAKARHHAGVAQRTVDRLAARVFQPDLDRLSARLAEPATEHRVTARSR